MKKHGVFLLALLPVLVGYGTNALFGAGVSLLYFIGFLMLGLWAWAGTQFARAGVHFLPALLGANAMGILALVGEPTGLWSASNGIVAAFFSFCGQFLIPVIWLVVLPLVSLAMVPALAAFKDVILAAQNAACLLLMLLAFAAGYWINRRRTDPWPR